MLNIDYNAENKVFTATFTGRLDTLAVQKISEAIQIHFPVKEGTPEDTVVFDLKDVEYISSSFIRICVSVAREAGPGNFAIVHCQPFIKKIYKISGLDEMLNVS